MLVRLDSPEYSIWKSLLEKRTGCTMQNNTPKEVIPSMWTESATQIAESLWRTQGGKIPILMALRARVWLPALLCAVSIYSGVDVRGGESTVTKATRESREAGVWSPLVIDSSPLLPAPEGYLPCVAYYYQSSSSSTGRIAVVRVPNACPQSKVNIAAFRPGLYMSESNAWTDLELPNLAPTMDLWTGAKVDFNQYDELVLSWVGHMDDTASDQQTIYARRMVSGGTWTTPINLGDQKIEDLQSFSLIDAHSGEMAVAWIDSRVKRFSGWSHPSDEGYGRAYYREWVGGKLSPVEQITEKRGKYVANGIRISTNSSGDVFAIWEQWSSKVGPQVFVAERMDASWSKPFQVSDDPINWNRYHHSYQLLPIERGRKWILWIRTQPAGSLVMTEYVKNKSGDSRELSSEVEHFAAAKDSRGRVYVAMEKRQVDEAHESADSPFDLRSIYLMHYDKGVWSEERKIAANVYRGSVNLEISPTDELILVWQEIKNDQSRLLYISKDLYPGSSGG